MKFAADFKPKVWIKDGDFLNMAGYNEKDPRKQQEPIEYVEKDINAGIIVLDDYQSVLPTNCTKVFMEGNHCYWETQYFRKHPAQRISAALYRNVLQLDKRGYEFRPYHRQKPYKVGDLYFFHGYRTGIGAIVNHLTKDCHASFVMGHIHYAGRAHSRTITGKLIEGFSIPAMCQRDWNYTEFSNTEQGFGVFYVLPNGKYQFYQIVVENYSFVFEGQVYSLNEQRRAA
jgi:hypothetical protein